MKLRFAAPPVVIDIGRVPGLDRIRISKGTIHIGGLVTHYQIESNNRLRRRCPLLPETAGEIGDVQVRNRGTLGGSIAHADPAADWPAAVLALDARVELAGADGSREVPAGDFFVDMLTTAIEPGEILREVRMPEPPARSGGAYVKMHQSASGFAITGVAVQIALDDAGTIASAGVGVTGVAPVAYRASAVEQALVGRAPEASVLAEAASHAAEGADDVNEDHHASADYRRHLAVVFARRALARAVERARA